MTEYSKSNLNKVIRGSNRAVYDEALINEILDDAFMCHVAYVWEDNAIVIPTAYGRKGKTIYIHGSLKNRMITQLLAAKKASMTVTHLDGMVLARSAFHHSANYRSAVIFGKVRKVNDAVEKMDALACILNHMLPGHWNHTRHPNEKEFNATLVMAIEIETASAKVRAVGVEDEKVDYEGDFWAGVVPINQVMDNVIEDPLLKKGISIPESVLRIIEK